MPLYQIQVDVTPTYLPHQSSPEEGVYVFAYTIQIRNTGTVAAQLPPASEARSTRAPCTACARSGAGRPITLRFFSRKFRLYSEPVGLCPWMRC